MITVLYSCKECSIVDRKVQVPAREGAEVDVVEWMNEVVMPCLQLDHIELSPRCRARSLQMVKIPHPPEAEFVGQQIE